MLDNITPVILTYNEAANIERSLQQLSWASRIVIIDSYSTDETIEIMKRFSNVEVFQRSFDTHTNQWNFGLSKATTEWVISLDADYVLSDELIAEISDTKPSEQVNGYFVSFQYCVFGKPLKATILPPRQMLFRNDKATYVDDGHTQLLRVEGNSLNLVEKVFHDDRKPLSRWLWAQDRYMVIEAQKLNQEDIGSLSWGDRVRKQKVLAPIIIFVYCLILKGGIRDGWRGWYYAFQRMFAETLLSLRLLEISE